MSVSEKQDVQLKQERQRYESVRIGRLYPERSRR